MKVQFEVGRLKAKDVELIDPIKINIEFTEQEYMSLTNAYPLIVEQFAAVIASLNQGE